MDNYAVQGDVPSRSAAGMPHDRQAFHKPYTTLSATGHWIKTLGILSPLLIGEFVRDPERRWRFTRIAVIATPALSEGLYTHRLQRERQEREPRRGRWQ